MIQLEFLEVSRVSTHMISDIFAATSMIAALLVALELARWLIR